MIIAYLDCFAGISGDMTVGALIDCGADFNTLEKIIASLGLKGYELSCSRTTKNGISGTKFDVTVNGSQPHRHLGEIIDIITRSSMSDAVKSDSIGIFRLIAAAESKIHNTGIEKIHFHEIGAVDSIIDICGSCAAIEMLGIKQVFSSPVNTGRGVIKTEHGLLPVPAPATAELLTGIKIYSGEIDHELTTPTGAAILSWFAGNSIPMPPIRISITGYGAGTRNLSIPNLLRIFIGEYETNITPEDEVTEIECTIDDMNPEIFSYIFEKLFADGALDVLLIPSIGKKNRPCQILKILCPVARTDDIVNSVFSETTTSGLRINRVKRKILTRKNLSVSTIHGIINVKIHEMNGEIITVSPEYEDCRKIALLTGIPLKKIYSEAQKEAVIKIQEL